MKLLIEIDLDAFEKEDGRTRHYELQTIFELINASLRDMRRDEEGRHTVYDLKNNPVGFSAVAAESEADRLKAGRFTPEEFQNLCHTREVQDGFEAFGLGCIAYQRQLFGKSYVERPTMRPREDWHEDFGDVFWWHLPIEEPPHFGCPLSSDWPENGDEYYTHWSAVQYPKEAQDDGN
jgi:hypothetical protein